MSGTRRGDAITSPLLDRRLFLVGSAAAASSLLLPSRARASQHFSDVRPRDAWGASLPPTGPLEEEARSDVRFLLLHHSASGNDYSADDVPGILRSFYHYHTGDKGWPDIAYNFLIDRYGTVWEGRAGSLSGPVKGSATGGSQGFALLCCFIGNHASARPTDAAIDAMAGVCAALAYRYGIDTSPGTQTSFVSRGSNKHAEGKEVTTTTVAGHRDMSQTSCPGDTGYRLVRDEMPERITRAKRRMEEAGRDDGDSGSDGGDDGNGDDGNGDDGNGDDGNGGDGNGNGSSDDGGSSDPEPTDDSDADDSGEEAEPEPEVPDRRGDVSAPEVAPPEAGSPARAGGLDSDGTRASLLDQDLSVRRDHAPPAAVAQEESLLDSLGLRELTVLGVAAAATLGGAAVAKHRSPDEPDDSSG